MTNINLKINETSAEKVSQKGRLTTGMVGATVTFEFGNEWEKYKKAAVFRSGGITKSVFDIGNTVRIPGEVLQKEGYLDIGVEGYNDENVLVYPTKWARGAWVYAGANASGDPAADPTLPIWAQLQTMIGDLSALDTDAKTSLVAAANELAAKSGGTMDEETVKALVEQYLADNPITAADVGAIPAPPTAEVGQTILVKAVNEKKEPVEWECVDAANGGSGQVLIAEYTYTANQVYQPTAFDISTGVFTCPAHGIVATGGKIDVIVVPNDEVKYDSKKIPGAKSHCGLAVIDENSFSIIDWDYQNDANVEMVDVAAFHFEKTHMFILEDIPVCNKMQIEIYGKIVSTSWTQFSANPLLGVEILGFPSNGSFSQWGRPGYMFGNALGVFSLSSKIEILDNEIKATRRIIMADPSGGNVKYQNYFGRYSLQNDLDTFNIRFSFSGDLKQGAANGCNIKVYRLD